MIVLAIDPGNEQSAWCSYDADARRPMRFAKCDNGRMLDSGGIPKANHLAIEMIASYGMPVGHEVFDTCVWIGRFIEAWGGPFTFVYRRDVKLHLCGSSRAKDGNVRQALLDRYGGKKSALGTKASPGPLYGFKADIWSALAVAVTYSETCGKSKPSDSWSVSA
jgi:hypothetical protein